MIYLPLQNHWHWRRDYGEAISIVDISLVNSIVSACLFLLHFSVTGNWKNAVTCHSNLLLRSRYLRYLYLCLDLYLFHYSADTEKAIYFKYFKFIEETIYV